MDQAQPRTPHIIRSMKVMLMNISAAQIILALLAWFSQGRILPGSYSTAFTPAGPSRMPNPMTYLVICASIYGLATYVELMVVHTMFCRYRMLQTKRLSTAQLLLSFVIMAIWPLMIVVLPNTGSRQYDGVMEDAIRIITWRNMVKLVVTNREVQSKPSVRHFILKTLDIKNQQLSGITTQSSETFLKALTVQAMVPILCFAPGLLLGHLMAISGSEIVLVEYVPYILGTLPCVVDPLITIFFRPTVQSMGFEKVS